MPSKLRLLVCNTCGAEVDRICRHLAAEGLVEFDTVWVFDHDAFDGIPLRDSYDFIVLLAHPELKPYAALTSMLQRRYPTVPLALVDETDYYDSVGAYKRPVIAFKRELGFDSKLLPDVRYIPFPKCSEDHGVPGKPKDIDISCLMGTSTPRRLPFFEQMRRLQKSPHNVIAFDSLEIGYPSERYIDTIQRSKISVGYFGNGYDCIRTYEILSCGTCLAMPDDPLITPRISNKLRFAPGLHDLVPVLLEALASGSWEDIGRRGYEEFLKYHTVAARARTFYEGLLSVRGDLP